jgi:hypothetical protein
LRLEGGFHDIGRFRVGGGGGDGPLPRRIRAKTIFLLVIILFRLSELPSNLGVVFVEPSSEKLFRPPFRPKKDHGVN